MDNLRESTAVAAVLTTGLCWFYRSEQPDGSLCNPFGIVSPVVEGLRFYRFGIPDGEPDGLPSIVVTVAYPRSLQHPGQSIDNPVDALERELVARICAGFGVNIRSELITDGQERLHLVLDRPAHPSLLAARDRYRQGCPEHGLTSSCCIDTWWLPGYARLIKPDWS